MPNSANLRLVEPQCGGISIRFLRLYSFESTIERVRLRSSALSVGRIVYLRI